MRVSGVQDWTGATLLAAARSVQAVAVESFDRSIAAGERTPFARGVRSAAGTRDLEERFVATCAEVLDDTYEVAQRLLTLHREFAQRLFEVLETRWDSTVAQPHGTSVQVVHLHTARTCASD